MAGKSVVVTGASTGIGRATALLLDTWGWHVFAGVRSEADGEALKEMASSRLQPVRIDVTDSASIAAAVTTVTTATGDDGITGLVNNAGVAVAGPFELVPLDDVRRQFEVNLFGQIAVTQAFLPSIRTGKGRIVNVGSIAGLVAVPFLGPYSASKHALEAFTDSLRMELRPWGIDVVIIEPGAVATPIWKKRTHTKETEERYVSDPLYGPTLATMQEYAERSYRSGIPAQRVAERIARALMESKPRLHQRVGREAEIAAASRSLPRRLRDRLVRESLGLK